MESPDKLYMLFEAGKTFFLIPFCCLTRVADSAPEDAKAVSLHGAAGKNSLNVQRPYYILVKSGKDTELCIKADDVMGILELEPWEIMELGEPVVHEKNHYLRGAVCREIASYGFRIIYLIDPAKL